MMKNPILIRPAGPDDLEAVLSLYHDLIPEDLPAPAKLTVETFRKMLDQPGLTVLLALRDSKPVATLTIAVVPNLTRGCAFYALIENVVTLTPHRGKGIGKRLMADAIERCWKAGCFKVMLLSGSQNANAHAFYEDLGFQQSKAGFEIRRPGYAQRRIT